MAILENDQALQPAKLTIDDYTFSDTIAFGNFGQVYKATYNKKEYAIKQVKKESIKHMKYADHLISEL